MHLIGNLRCRLVRVAQFYFYTRDEGTVNPVFGCDAACLADNGAQVALSEAHAVGIEADLMLMSGMLVDEVDKPVEDSLFAALRCLH